MLVHGTCKRRSTLRPSAHLCSAVPSQPFRSLLRPWCGRHRSRSPTPCRCHCRGLHGRAHAGRQMPACPPSGLRPRHTRSPPGKHQSSRWSRRGARCDAQARRRRGTLALHPPPEKKAQKRRHKHRNGPLSLPLERGRGLRGVKDGGRGTGEGRVPKSSYRRWPALSVSGVVSHRLPCAAVEPRPETSVERGTGAVSYSPLIAPKPECR